MITLFIIFCLLAAILGVLTAVFELSVSLAFSILKVLVVVWLISSVIKLIKDRN